MSYDEEQHKRSRVVVETPTARREVVQQQTVRYPTPERRGYSAGVLATVALVAIATTAILFLFLTNSGGDDSSETNVNIRAATQPTPFTQAPVLVQTPMTQPTPIIIQQAPQTVPAPVIIQAPPATDPAAAAPPVTTATAPPAAPAPSDDATLQQRIDKSFADDPAVAAATIDATVINGRVKLSGTVSSDAVKQRAERLAYAVKGVLGVDNRIVVTPATP
ncbi:MAG TPA: BON domain-containing protein [Pyrinomonadaceae bacterium]